MAVLEISRRVDALVGSRAHTALFDDCELENTGVDNVGDTVFGHFPIAFLSSSSAGSSQGVTQTVFLADGQISRSHRSVLCR
mgnify:CR=1 FL=1